MNVVDLITGIVDSLVPPDSATDQSKRLHMWRLTVMACSTFWVVLIVVILAFGWAPRVFSGFAHSSDVGTLRGQVANEAATAQSSFNTIDEKLIKSAMIESLKQRCALTGNTTPVGKQLYASISNDVQSDEDEYFDKSHLGLRQPSCTELGF